SDGTHASRRVAASRWTATGTGAPRIRWRCTLDLTMRGPPPRRRKHPRVGQAPACKKVSILAVVLPILAVLGTVRVPRLRRRPAARETVPAETTASVWRSSPPLVAIPDPEYQGER